jgi:ABC-2 type transport system permease protein
MVPGILVLLVTMLTLFLSAMNIVREKKRDIGTNKCYPNKKHQFIIGKLPFWVLGLMLFDQLTIARLVFRFHIREHRINLPVYHGVFTGYTR